MLCRWLLHSTGGINWREFFLCWPNKISLSRRLRSIFADRFLHLLRRVYENRSRTTPPFLYYTHFHCINTYRKIMCILAPGIRSLQWGHTQESLRNSFYIFIYFFSILPRLLLQDGWLWGGCLFLVQVWKSAGGWEREKAVRHAEKRTHTQKKTWDRRHLHPKVTHTHTQSGSDSSSVS